MTPEQVTDLAERINAAIDVRQTDWAAAPSTHVLFAADRKRVASDLRAWHRAAAGLAQVDRLKDGWLGHSPSVCLWLRHTFTEAQTDAEAGLTRTAELYGVPLTPTTPGSPA